MDAGASSVAGAPWARPLPQSTTDLPSALLGAAVVATAFGMAVASFRGDGTALNSLLFLDLGLAHGEAARVECTAVSIMLLVSIAAALWRSWPLFLPALAYILAEAVARRHVQGQAYSDWVLTTQAARHATPLAAMLWLYGTRPTGRRWGTAAIWTLRMALAATFVGHGLEAVQANPAFIDLIISSAANLGGARVTETSARAVLEVIGPIDFAVAGGLLLWPHRLVLGWAAFWAAVTALSRITANGWDAYGDVLVRASYFLGPVALALLIARNPSVRESESMPAANVTAASDR